MAGDLEELAPGLGYHLEQGDAPAGQTSCYLASCYQVDQQHNHQDVTSVEEFLHLADLAHRFLQETWMDEVLHLVACSKRRQQGADWWALRLHRHLEQLWQLLVFGERIC